MMRMPAVGAQSTAEPPAAYTLRAVKPALDESLSTFLARPVRIFTTTITGAVATNTSSFPGYNGNDSLLQAWRTTPGVSNKLEGYGLFRGTPKITITVTGSPVMMGTALFSFLPAATNQTGISVNYPLKAPWFTQARPGAFRGLRDNLPKLVCAVEEVKTYELSLPWAQSCPAHSLLTVCHDWYWSVELLGAPFRRNDGLTADPIIFELFVSYESVELSQPIQINGATDVEGPWLSSRLKYASSVMSQASTVFPFVTPWAAITGALGSFAQSMGFARSLELAMSTQRIEVPGNTSFYSGAPFFGQKIADDPAVATDVSGVFIPMTEKGDTKISFVAGKWGLIYAGLAPVSGGAPLEFQVDPMACGPASTSPVATVVTPLAFVTLPFRWWSGDLEYNLEFESNALARCRYAIQIIPQGAVTPATYTGATFFRTTLVDVVGRTVVNIDAKWQRETFWLFSGGPFTATNTSLLDARMVVYALDPVPAGIQIGLFVRVRAGENFKLAVPSQSLLDFWRLTPYAAPPALKAEEEFLVDEPVIHGANEDASLGMSCFGTNHVDLVELSRRAGFIFTSTTMTALGFALDPLDFAINTTAFGIPGSLITMAKSSLPLHLYLRSAYLGFSGGFRMMIVDRGSSSFDVVLATQPNGTVGRVLAGDTPFGGFYHGCAFRPTSVSPRDIHEFEGRVDHPAPFRPGFVFGSTNTIAAVPMAIALGLRNAEVWGMGADDFVFHGFLTPPPLYLAGP